jgi:deoxyribonuclease-4
MESREGLQFGTAGIPLTAKAQSTQAGIERIVELGLGCMEVEFVQGVRMGEQAARGIGELAASRGVRLSAHAPYYVNLNAQEPEKVSASRERIIKTARITSAFGGTSIVFHAAYYLKENPLKVYATVKDNLERITAELNSEGNHVAIRPEITGKESQFGNLEEVLRLSSELPGISPAIDFAHLHARTGEVNSYDEFMAVLMRIEDTLGREALDDMHIHVSGIEYGANGEIRHIPLADSDLEYVELLRALQDYGVKGSLICESPNLEEDALLLQETYMKL